MKLPAFVSDTIELPPNMLLEANKNKFETLVLVGFEKDGELRICGSHTVEHTLFLLEKAKHWIMENS